MKKLKIGLLGSTGRMGTEISRLVEASREVEISLAPKKKSQLKSADFKKVDVWIDFTLPEAFEQNLKMAVESQKAFVCGTTGLSTQQYKLLASAAKKIPVLWASNMSIGVAVLNRALEAFSAISDFDFQIEEIHHIHKKDKPSGTAITLQKNLEKVVKRNLPHPLSIRGGGVFGVHKIFAMSAEEVVTFEHTALNRGVFAKGAVKAAMWLAGKKPGLYSIEDCFFGKRDK